ncbi:MAG: hypothetical protein CMJ24_02140 [Phycisphaerae bacterium]|jgi:enoyl-CoA hydratase/carnithine racemase|nr:hypothetical protein [Phycisphaerae bacterium]MAB82220.1 hypothetical protein [Phycisphaerae bacterium]|tara:strand:- start:4971 stop:5732 length:762 start_codon:yes stop_codon:yes gene_type:complete
MMTTSSIHVTDQSPVLWIELDDPDRRNAMTIEMLDELLEVIDAASKRDDLASILLSGRGRCFCAGFDLGAVVEDPMMLDELIRRLGMVTKSLRRMPQTVVVAAHGAAIAGGCALLTGGDVVFIDERTVAGYPVHALGVSPAVTIPTLRQIIGDGPARELLLGGELLKSDGIMRIGLGTHLAPEGTVIEHATAWAREAASRSSSAMKATKTWLNALDGSDDDDSFSGPVAGSAALTGQDEAVELLAEFWKQRNA